MAGPTWKLYPDDETEVRPPEGAVGRRPVRLRRSIPGEGPFRGEHLRHHRALRNTLNFHRILGIAA